MVRFSTFVALLAFVAWLPIYTSHVSIGKLFRPLTDWKRWPMTRAKPWILEREKRLDAARTLKNSEADLLKAREDLKEVSRARDSAELGLTSAQKQAEDQTRRLLEAEEQLQITKEQIVDLKKKLAEEEGAKKVAKWAKDEA